MAKILKNIDLANANLDSDQTLWVYNGMDTAITYEVWDNLRGPVAKRATTAYNFERGMLRPALTMMMRGLKIDEAAVAALVPELEAERALLMGLFADYCTAIGIDDPDYRSPIKLKKLFYVMLQIPEIRKSEKGVWKVSLDREALERISHEYPRGEPFARCLLALRDIDKQLDVLTCKRDEDGRFRTAFNVAGTETWRWSSSQSPFWTGCLLPSAEVLTPSGWVAFANLPKNITAAVYDPTTGRIKFDVVEHVTFPFTGNLLAASGEQFRITLTPDHNVGYWDSRLATWKVGKASAVSKLSQLCLPLSGELETAGGAAVSDAFLRVAVMCLADGSREWNKFRLAFTKQRKIVRCKELLEAAGIEYSLQKTKQDYVKFACAGVDIFKFTGDKYQLSWLLNLSTHQKEVVLDELAYWDGHRRNKSAVFYSADKLQVEALATIAHLVGRSATIKTVCNFRGYNKNPDAVLHLLNVKPRKHARVAKKHWSTQPYIGNVHCLVTNTKFFLVRQDGFISITGNSNVQNITDRLRKIIMPDDGMQLFYADLEQAESRAVAYLSGEEAYIAACENGDLHTTVAKMVWDNLTWSGNLAEDKAIAEQPFYRHFSYRDLAKRGGHAKNYMITAMSMARRLRIPYRIAMRFELQYLGGEILQKDLERWHQQEPGGGFDLLIDTADDIFGEGDKRIVVVRGAFPGIRDWHDSVKEQLQTKGQLTTPFGMTRTFWGRPTEDVTLRGAVAHNPQSTIGCLLNVALYRLVNELEPIAPMQCLAQIHDAVLGQIPIGSEKELVPEILKRMVNPLKVGDRMMSIPSSIELGGRWGKFDPKNPTDNPLGMRKFKL